MTTKSASNRILKDVNGSISDHLRNHIHLTNCIHLKNHMHSKQSPNRSLMRDLTVLQRSARSLRDPSTSPSEGHDEPRDGLKDFGIHRGVYVERRGKSVKRRRRHMKDGRVKNEMSVASNSFGQCENRNVSKNGCGIPWNWSRIHHRGKARLDVSELTRLKNASDDENTPSPSRGCAGGADRFHDDYSGELGIFADNNDLMLNPDIDSDLVSEARFGGKCSSRSRRNNTLRHQSLTQKYMPRTFKDLVGQNLVAKALSNAVGKRKVGLLYVFYGPNGTGKTSSARIFSRALNCQSPNHLSKPCGACNSCISYGDNRNGLNIREIGPASDFGFENLMDLLEMMNVSQYRVLIFDDCDDLGTRSWNSILKVADRAPWRVVFILICSRLDVLPHTIISRCQKFFFPKLKDADMIHMLQCIAVEEDIEIDRDALKLVAMKSNGSLRDAEMTLEQLSLLGQRISVSLVQELVGLIPDEKLVDLLDLALSADTVNTVKSLREILESGIEPLSLMSQLAAIITDILAGSYNFTKESPRRKFFHSHALSKDDMEKLRQALRTLSEAEKQLRVSSDKVTWLTAALLQLAPDQQYLLPSSSAETSFGQSPLGFNHGSKGKLLKTENVQTRSSSKNYKSTEKRGIADIKQHSVADIWLDVIKRIKITSLKEFLFREGRLVSVTFGTAPKVRLVFSSHVTRSKAKKFRVHISQAFESVLGSSPVTVEIKCETRKDSRSGGSTIFPTSHEGSSSHIQTSSSLYRRLQEEKEGSLQAAFGSTGIGENEIVELEETPPREEIKQLDGHVKPEVRNLGNGSWNNMSLVRGKVTLAQVLQRAEECAQLQYGWSHRKAVSIAEKLEKDNLRLEPLTRSLLCCKGTRASRRRKLSRVKTKGRRPRALLKFVSCGKCLSGMSSR
ncbi:unnamed protein product [Cuscuta campestris]|uniref:AAA+ ATPase domain-containing protein n=1 Tax=Cuscuta campestris TaxID=132261 RepID=A0A484K367_9ASTE|nr:unnamed protein product [Cuscuta campestris]